MFCFTAADTGKVVNGRGDCADMERSVEGIGAEKDAEGGRERARGAMCCLAASSHVYSDRGQLSYLSSLTSEITGLDMRRTSSISN